MSIHQFPRSATISESNIPLPKRIGSGVRKSKRCAQLPELQKYIETIIKASNEYDSEDTSRTERDRFPKDRKFGRYSVYKGQSKQEKDKNQLNLSGSKSSIKAKTQSSEAVSRGIKVYSTFAPEFEDPRNWKLGITQNLGPSVEIEKFLKKFYPNPYQLESFIEFNQSRNDKDELRDGTLPDVVISKANIHNEVDIEKRDKDLQMADNEPCKRENKDITISSDTILEIQASPCYESKSQEGKDIEMYSLSVPALSEKPSTVKSVNSITNTSSRASSPESTLETFSKDSQMSIRKRKGMKAKARSKLIKSERNADYDIGKLKLLNLSDSEHSTSQLRVETSKTVLRDDEKNSSLGEENTRKEDLKGLEEIYDIMNKATESFLYINSKNESADFSKSLMESNIYFSNSRNDTTIPLDNSESNKSTEFNHFEKTTVELNNSENVENKFHKAEEKIDDNSVIGKEEPGLVGKSLIDILLKEDKFEYRCNPEDSKPEQVEYQSEIASNYEETTQESSKSPYGGTSEEEKDFNDTSQKIDEVLDFMYGCLKKFNKENKEKLPFEEVKKPTQEDAKMPEKSISCKRFRKESVTVVNLEKPSTSVSLKQVSVQYQPDFFSKNQESTENILAKTFPDIKDIQSKYSAALGEINRKASRTRCRKRPTITGSESPHEASQGIPAASEMPPAGNMITQFPVVQHSREETNDNQLTLQTVESQNELGSFTEDRQVIINDESRTLKPICPLSVKRKKSKTNTGQTLKDVLEAEEKLLSGWKTGKEEDVEEEKDLITTSGTTESHTPKQNDTTKVYSHLGDFKRSSSNFIVCVNTFPRNPRSISPLKPNLPLPVSSLGDLKKKSSVKQIILPPKAHMKKISIDIEAECSILQHNYNIKQEVLLTLNKTLVVYAAHPICLKIVIRFSRILEEFSLKRSECLIMITTVPVKKPSPLRQVESTPSVRAPAADTEDDKPVKDLIEAIEQTEEKLFLLEQSSAENLYSRNSEMCSLSTSETLKNEVFSEYEIDKVNDRKKVHELLLRTYNLQQKLQRYLQKMTSQPTSVSCPVVQQEGILDFSAENKIRTEINMMKETSLSVVHWHLKPPETDIKTRADESITVNVSMIDHSTSYEPPVEEKFEKANEPDQEKKSERDNDDTGNEDDDDRSSNYSFKSSNDFSESSEARIKKDYKNHKIYFQKIFNEFESFRQSYEAEKLGKQQQYNDPGPKEPAELLDRRLTLYDQKTPAKVLRTVFTGKKSSTELTIGLKDVPMTKVGNISVEKTKFSPNHTRISVAFTKESSEDNKPSSFFFDNMRPLSNCVTEFSGMKDDGSKSSQSLNPESEDDEEDYKSVGSAMGNSDLDVDEEVKTEPREEKTAEKPSSKDFTRHRFDFYRKMNTDMDTSKTKLKSVTSSVCRFKELEPLKQALTDMQIRMRNIRREAIFSSNDYYERALKLAKMSAGFCQSCGNRSVIPNDTFGYYRTLLPRRTTNHRRHRHFRTTLTPSPSFYSLRSSNMEVGDQFCELGIKHSSYLLNPRLHSNRTVLRSSLHDMPILFEGI